MAIIKAIFVSVWDGGTEIRTSCTFDTETKDATNIEASSGNRVDVLDDEFVELPDGEEVRDFTIDGKAPNQEEIYLEPKDIEFLRGVVDKHYDTPDQE